MLRLKIDISFAWENRIDFIKSINFEQLTQFYRAYSRMLIPFNRLKSINLVIMRDDARSEETNIDSCSAASL